MKQRISVELVDRLLADKRELIKKLDICRSFIRANHLSSQFEAFSKIDEDESWGAVPSSEDDFVYQGK